MNMIPISDLKTVIDTCKKAGVRHLKMGDLELTFDATEEVDTSPRPVNRDVKPGTDGLTAAEQAELYGTTFDASN